MANQNIDHAFTARSKTGAAFEPTYAGALSFMRRKYTKDVKGADAVVWGIPFDAAVTNRPGARFGPRAIRSQAYEPGTYHLDLGIEIFDWLEVVDFGDAYCPHGQTCLLYTSPSPRDRTRSRMPSSA